MTLLFSSPRLLLGLFLGVFCLGAGVAPGIREGQREHGDSETIATSRSLASVPASEPLRSLLSAPLFLGAEPPPCRTLQVLHLNFSAQGTSGRTHAEAVALAGELRRAVLLGKSFGAAVAEYSEAPNAGFGGIVGTFPPGVLKGPLERFLWSAELGQVSDPIERSDSVLLLARTERWAGCRLILIKSEGADDSGARLDAVMARLEAGEDFAQVARELSQDPRSRGRGGNHAVFERGTQDRLLKRAIFEAAPGELIGPLELPTGLVVAQRVAPEDIEPDLWESNWARVRSLLISFREAAGPVELNGRTFRAAADLAERLNRELREEGSDLADLASRYNDDLDGRERAGDLGWIRRDAPNTAEPVLRVFHQPPGELIGPLPLEIGTLFLRREDR